MEKKICNFKEEAHRCVTEVIGLQWGDEGKGKYAHIFSKNAKLVLRTTGGNNAGHTVVVDRQMFTVHLLPSSIVRSDVLSIICSGVVIDPEVFNDEIEKMREQWIPISSEKLLVSNRAHVIFPYTKDMDLYQEYIKEEKIGTTKRGIGPCYADKMNRVGIRVGDLYLSDYVLEKKIKEAIKIPNILFGQYRRKRILTIPIRIVKKIKGQQVEEDLGFHKYKVPEIMKLCKKYREYLEEYHADVQHIIWDAINNGEEIVIEGAQAHSLDIDHGDYPFCTSSSPNASGALSGAGIGPMYVKRVCGVFKAYCSRVGAGPFLTKQTGALGEMIREEGYEYGTTTGRPRDVGWLDLVQLKEAIMASSVTELCINHIDTIGRVGLMNDNCIEVCIGYFYKRKVIDYIPVNPTEYVLPKYEMFKGWNIEGKPKNYEELPENCRKYIEFIEEKVGVPIKYIGIGPEENDYVVH